MKPKVENSQAGMRQKDNSGHPKPPYQSTGGGYKRYARYAEYYMQPAFLICAAVLAIAGGSMSIAIESFGVHLKKHPLPLKKPLDLLDEEALAPYKVVSKEKIDNADVIEELGTEDYIQWDLEDPDAAPDSPVRKCRLFITYYGLPDRVPHVPDECYVGFGYQRLASGIATFEVDKDGASEKLRGRYAVFSGTSSSYWQSSAKFSVLYLFNTNGLYAGSRADARFTLNRNIRGKYSYFSKIEWKFFNSTGFGAQVYPSKEEAVAASKKLLTVLLPILEREHWPDWPVVNGK